MRYLAVDISGKVENYDKALYQAIQECLPEDAQLVFACPYYTISKNAEPFHLISLVPASKRQSANLFKRVLKALEGVLNYLHIQRFLRKYPVEVLHLQWLPFLEVCSLEKYILRHLHRRYPNMKIILTIHNIYPHDSDKKHQTVYRKRMIEDIRPYISHYIVHTQSSKQKIIEEFGISLENISVIPHGIFMPALIPTRIRLDDKIRLLMFGQQSPYKGTDLLIEAIEQIQPSIRHRLDVHIMGRSNEQLVASYWGKAEQLDIMWHNGFVNEQDLYQAIQDADILIYPYRSISQSGALLLGIAFRKPMILSDLPSFKETMGNEYPQELFFHNGDAHKLAQAITHCMDNYAEYKNQVIPTLKTIIEDNSWGKAAVKTIALYNKENVTC